MFAEYEIFARAEFHGIRFDRRTRMHVAVVDNEKLWTQMTRIRNAIFEHAEYLHTRIMPASASRYFAMNFPHL